MRILEHSKNQGQNKAFSIKSIFTLITFHKSVLYIPFHLLKTLYLKKFNSSGVSIFIWTRVGRKEIDSLQKLIHVDINSYASALAGSLHATAQCKNSSLKILKIQG